MTPGFVDPADVIREQRQRARDELARSYGTGPSPWRQWTATALSDLRFALLRTTSAWFSR